MSANSKGFEEIIMAMCANSKGFEGRSNEIMYAKRMVQREFRELLIISVLPFAPKERQFKHFRGEALAFCDLVVATAFIPLTQSSFSIYKH